MVRPGSLVVSSVTDGGAPQLRKAMVDFRTVLEDLLQGQRTAA